MRPLKNIIQKMKKRFLIAALFSLFLGGIARAQSQEQSSTLTELQAEKEKLETKLAKTVKMQAEDAFFAFNKNISKKQRKIAKMVLRGTKRQEKQIKKKLKKLNKRIEKIKKEEITN